MKLSRKIIGYLASASVIAAAATTIVACSSNAFKPTPEHDDPGWDIDVYFDASQSKTINVNSDNYNDFTVGNFHFSRDLGEGEEVIVKSTNPDQVDLVNSGYMPHPVSTFSLETKINTQQAPDENVTYDFGYIFEFYKDDQLMSTKRIDNFKVKYVKSPAAQNNLTWTLLNGTDKQFQVGSGALDQKSITLTGFKLARPIDPDLNERLSFTVSPELSGRKFTISQPTIDGTAVSVTVTYVNPEEYTGESAGFHIDWKIEDDEYGEKTGTETGFEIYSKAEYIAPKIEIQNLPTEETPSIDYVTEAGFKGVYCNSYANFDAGEVFFNLDRPLAENERISVYSSNKRISATASISPYEWERPDANDTDVPLVDLSFSFNNIVNAFESVPDETFYLTFCFYEGNQLKAVQDLKFGTGEEDYLPFNISYTPLVDPDPTVPDNYGIALDSVVVDTRGEGTFTFTGTISRENDPTGQLGLQPGDYLTIYNASLCDEYTGRSGEPETATHSLLKFTLPNNDVEYNEEFDRWDDKPSVKIQGEGQTEIQFQVEWYSPDMESLMEETWPDWYNPMTCMIAMLQDVYDFISDLHISFYDKNDKLINEQTSQIDFLLYPPGFWSGTSDEIVDNWISNRSMAIICRYDDDQGIEHIIDGTAWVMSIVEEGSDQEKEELFDLVTSWDVVNEFKWVLGNEDHDLEWLIDHNVRFGAAVPNGGSTYNIKNFDTTKYLSLDDFIYPDLIAAKTDGHKTIEFPESEPFVWDSETKTNGSNVGIIKLGADFLMDYALTAEDPEILNNNFEILMKTFLPWSLLMETTTMETIDVDGKCYISNCQGFQYESKGTKTPITNWDEIQANYSNAVISGFSSKELEIDGKKDTYYYWTSKSVDFSSNARPTFKTIEDSASQGFENLTNDVPHQSYAYELPNSYNSDPEAEDAWFSSAGRGAMMAVRQWTTVTDEQGEHQVIDIPRVAGINWNGGAESIIGTNMFKPWIDLFWWRDSTTSINLLEDYFLPMEL